MNPDDPDERIKQALRELPEQTGDPDWKDRVLARIEREQRWYRRLWRWLTGQP